MLNSYFERKEEANQQQKKQRTREQSPIVRILASEITSEVKQQKPLETTTTEYDSQVVDDLKQQLTKLKV